MALYQQILHASAGFLREHLQSISVGIVSVVLVLYGEDINRFFRKSTRKLHFLPRFALFVLLCSAGYGFLSSQAVKWLESWLRHSPDKLVVALVPLAFLVLGFLARAGKEV